MVPIIPVMRTASLAGGHVTRTGGCRSNSLVIVNSAGRDASAGRAAPETGRHGNVLVSELNCHKRHGIYYSNPR